ncbi:DNA polymerase III subunit beta [Campylobacter sputorum subsp. bubulus]|uniref:Beta sliding clamp n=1 Tax=Campylobacter sputorum subsp. sputorum TaxID=32024 RepID=A0A381DJS0_9BACT|nr:DNA polymerase III subunit beta [Campylobacter sputorum]ASM34272.1 DNA polymerase III, beta subunit [Campylobacter sputorum aubsp. sputorum RM3237]ASM35935.1 DNA polymerase III, beta subunit [Campylobacter sputorum bv. faecalis CCUG 20703]KAB0582333.1 DNA polymerase III subunit beta [Campylobacter sputorum subsp. sputorum]QEL04463.1 DNA polymerase III, beta subunit [Campylobacter sputorum subsp. sputorum]SUX09238.1 DNA polymerase III subunit beta [Campylobacter sputorum subsp. bubulus]
MRVKINKNSLESIVTNTKTYLEKKDTSSITSHIFLSANNGVLNVKATDYEIGLTYKQKNLTIIDEGEATANGRKLLSIISSLKDGDVTLETVQNYLYIKQNNSKYKLPMFKAEDFPKFPDIQNKNKFEIDSSILSRSLKKIVPCVDTNNHKFELNGALVDIKNDYINLVGTDTRRLGIYRIDTQTDKEFSIIIPKKAILEIQKLFYDKIEIYYDENTLIAVSDNFEFFTKLINGKFPDYARVIPKEIKTRIRLNRDMMIEGMKTISILSEQMKLTFAPNEIVFESIIEDNSEARTSIEFQTGVSENISICLKNRYLLDFLGSIEESEFDIELNSQETAFLVVCGNLKTVIMPIVS